MAKSSKKAAKPLRRYRIMAKSSKKAAKAAKKSSSKSKGASKSRKPVAKAKPVKKAVVKKAVVKKEVPAKVTMRKASSPPTPKPPTKRQEAMAKPLNSPQLNVFPILTQRPIAHKPQKNLADDRTRYSEDELKEFETLIVRKLDKAREEFRILKETLNRNNDAGTDATSGGNTKVLEDGAETAEKENLSQLAARQQKYIMNLENALVRIKNGTYGICTVTGKLIPKERLIAVPHTTQSIEAKMMQQD
jgi:RNA polymerase-binding transcription factor DksA